MRRLDLGEKQEARLIKLYRDGVEIALIKERFGLDRNQMHRILIKHGVIGGRKIDEVARPVGQ
jgi:hypothetical protein